MTRFQTLLWEKMIQFLRDYDQRCLSFHRLVFNLKKTVEDGGFEEGELLQGWHKVWMPLAEVIDENPSMDVDPIAVQPRVEHMRTYLVIGKSKFSPNNSLRQTWDSIDNRES